MRKVADITIFRECSFFLSLKKWKIYANGQFVAKIGNCRTTTFSLPEGTCEIFINCPDFPIPFRRKGLHSNVIQLEIEEGNEYYFGVCPHPLFWFGKHFPDWHRPFKSVECLLLLKQDTNFQDNIKRLEHIGKQIQDELKQFTYHPISLILLIAISLFAMVSNTIHPNLYATGDGLAWGFLFGISNLIGLLSGSNKQMLARGWEYKILLYTAFGAMLVLFFMPQRYQWQSDLYFFFILAVCFWAYFCFKRWKEKKKGLEKIEQIELRFEEGL